MQISEVSQRYAHALFEIAGSGANVITVFEQLRAFADSFLKDDQIVEFFNSPVINIKEKEKALEAALKSVQLKPELNQFLMLLVRKNRISKLPQIAEAFQALTDSANKVTRGEVVSAAILGPDERKQIEEIVSKVTNKKVILSYREENTLIGGLRAKVGSYSFDDSIQTHMNRLKEELKRRAN